MAKTDKEKLNLLDHYIAHSEKLDIKTFRQHVENQTVVDNFSLLVGKQLLVVRAEKPGEVLIPFQEHHGDHDMNYIILWDDVAKREIFRKNIRDIEMITWKK